MAGPEFHGGCPFRLAPNVPVRARARHPVALHRLQDERTRAWEKAAVQLKRISPLREIFASNYRRRTTSTPRSSPYRSSACGPGPSMSHGDHCAGKKSGMDQVHAVRMASMGTGLLSIGTILDASWRPPLCEMWGVAGPWRSIRGMALCIWLSFGVGILSCDGTSATYRSYSSSWVSSVQLCELQLWLPEQ